MERWYSRRTVTFTVPGRVWKFHPLILSHCFVRCGIHVCIFMCVVVVLTRNWKHVLNDVVRFFIYLIVFWDEWLVNKRYQSFTWLKNANAKGIWFIYLKYLSLSNILCSNDNIIHRFVVFISHWRNAWSEKLKGKKKKKQTK